MLFDLNSKQFFLSRHVVFYENMFPFHNKDTSMLQNSNSQIHLPTACPFLILFYLSCDNDDHDIDSNVAIIHFAKHNNIHYAFDCHHVCEKIQYDNIHLLSISYSQMNDIHTKYLHLVVFQSFVSKLTSLTYLITA